MLYSYGSGQKQIDGNKKSGESMAISIAMAMQRNNAGHIHLGLHSKPLDAPISQVPALYRPSSLYGQQFWSKIQNTTKKLFLTS